jgi:hypothetical protein
MSTIAGQSIHACQTCHLLDLLASQRILMNEVPDGASEANGTPSFLRQFARRRAQSDQLKRIERCELCSAELVPVHQHLLDPKKRQILCACDGCVVLFCGQTGAHYLRIPRRIRQLTDFQIADLQWESLMIPINLAFFFRDSAAGRMIAMYPSPAGATESLLSLDSWTEIADQNDALQTMESDVEAFLVNRIGAASEYFIVPIDECFRLVGLIRMNWKGLSGGTEVWKEINGFFTSLRERRAGKREMASA